MPSILDIIQQGRRDLLMGELSMTQAMLDAYALVWGEVERQLLRLEDNLLDADVPIGSDDATLQWLRSQAWYQQLMTSVDAQFARFGTDAQSIVGRSQVGAVHVSQDVSGKVRRWIDDRARTGFSANVRPNVMERWVSVIQPDSPLRGSIERHGIEAAEVIERRMTEGLGAGKGTNAIVRGIRQELGPDSPRTYELSTLVRTETNRAYRGAFQDEMDAVGTEVIPQKEWLAAHGPRTCAACLARDGMRVPLDYPDDMHVSCRCRWIPVINPDIVPGANPKRKLGSEWFAEQDEETQRKILRADGRFEAYQAGVPLSEMVGVRENAIWGKSVYVKPVRALRVPEAVPRPEWRPSMPAEEAARWAHGSSIPQTTIHVTRVGAEAPILRNGFDIGKGSLGKLYGEGVYMGPDEKTAEFYELLYAEKAGGSVRIHLRAKTEKTLEVHTKGTETKVEEFRIVLDRLPGGQAAYERKVEEIKQRNPKIVAQVDADERAYNKRVANELAAQGIDPDDPFASIPMGFEAPPPFNRHKRLTELGYTNMPDARAVNELAEDGGYDSIWIVRAQPNWEDEGGMGPSEIVVFDPKNVVVVEEDQP